MRSKGGKSLLVDSHGKQKQLCIGRLTQDSLLVLEFVSYGMS